jgi:uncharacterized integral membrane protein
VLQVLWLLGVLGALYVASQQPEQPLPLTIAQQPWTIWFVGPAAAAVTGVAIKEGECAGGRSCVEYMDGSECMDGVKGG